MSVVVAIKHNDTVYIGADSQITRGGTRRSLSNPNNYKIWRAKESSQTLVGAVGLVREMNITKMINFFEDSIENNLNIDYEFMVLKFIPKMFENLEKYKILGKDVDEIPKMNCAYLVAHQSKLYQIGYDGAVIEIDDFASIGSGANEAMGSLLSTMDLPPIERIKIAIKASAANDIYVDYPIVISNTNQDQFEVVYENEILIKNL